MDLNDQEKLDGFLGNVDKISELIKKLNSENEVERDEAVTEADGFLESKSIKELTNPLLDKTGVNRTLINRDASNSPSEAIPGGKTPSEQEAFLKALEQDSEERGRRRKQAKAEATEFKDKGNAAFKSGNYEIAVQLYSQGLERLKDFRELWTNRAQAYIKLNKYDEALADCDWAQRCDEEYVKAYVLEAKAHVGLGNYDTAIDVYEKAITIDKTKEKMLKEFIARVQLAKDSASEEKEARQLFDSGAQHPATLMDVLNKVNAASELPLYYDGGVRVLGDLLKDDKCKALFRAESGLEIYFRHPFFSRVMVTASLASLSREEIDACCGMFSLLTAASSNNEQSQLQLISQPEFPPLIMRFLDDETLRGKKLLRLACLSLLLSLSEMGAKYISAKFDINDLVRCLFKLVTYGGAVATYSLNTVNNLSLEGRFRRALHDSLDQVLPSFESLLASDKHTDVIPSCLTIMTNLCSDDKLRQVMSNRRSMVESSLEYLNKYPSSCLHQRTAYHKAVHAAVGFLMNITVNKTDTVRCCALEICKSVLPYLDKEADIQERVIGLLSHILTLSAQVVELFLSDEKRLDTVVCFLRQSLYLQYTVKALTACSQHSTQVSKLLGNDLAVITKLIELLNSDNEVLLGNTCLILSHCVAERSVHETLNKEDLKRLLVIVREAKGSAVKQNCAILIGKLVKANSRHLESLRELDGIGILHNSTRYYQL